MIKNVKMSDGKFYVDVQADVREGTIALSFPYSASLLAEVKTRFEGRKWRPEDKSWVIPITQRNLFQFEALQLKYGLQPYKKWDRVKDYTQEIKDFCVKRGLKPYAHQVSMVNQALNVGWFIWAAEMGTGKSLAAIIAMEMMAEMRGIKDYVWAGPKAPLVAVQLEFIKWRSPIQPRFCTYDGLKDLVKTWPMGKIAPQGLILDEVSRCKTPAAQRTVAAKHLATSIRNDHGMDSLVGGLSGSPSPKNPGDWWSLCEVIAPGFIREGNIFDFKARLGIFQKRETVPGAGSYNRLMGWLDDENKCATCGELKGHVNHSNDIKARMTGGTQTTERHEYRASVNEVANLSKRLNGLVAVYLKKDCLDLPAKRYEVIRLKPSRSLLNAAKLITQTSTRAVETLTRLRTLSDGFQYKEVKIGEECCYLCNGAKTILEWRANDESLSLAEVNDKALYIWDEDENGIKYIKDKVSCDPKQEIVECPRCKGLGIIDVLERQTAEVECGKDQVTRDILERHDEGGRLVIFAGFTGSIERVERICHEEGWHVLRVDGRGWTFTNEKNEKIDIDNQQKLLAFQDGQEQYQKICFVGQPGAGGMGLTLTASPSIFFYSNDFNFESRIQAEDRHHRLGMQEKGGLVIDVVNLPSDEYVLDNLKKKRDLQMLSMVGLKENMEKAYEQCVV